MNRKEACRRIAIKQGAWFIFAMTGAGFSIQLIRDFPEFPILGGVLFVGNMAFGMMDYQMMRLAIAAYQKEEANEVEE
jgi:hypothetical protein